MGGSPLLAWLLTVVFAATGLWFLLRAAKGPSLAPEDAGSGEAGSGEVSSGVVSSGVVSARRAGVADRVCSVAHALMSAAMIAMAWQWGMSVPAWPQVVVFAVATAWFALLAVRRPSGASSRAGPGAAPHAHGSGPLAHLHHAVMMACMVWMLVPMAMMSARLSGHAGHGGGHAMSSGMGGAMHMSTPSPVVNVVLGAGLLLSAVAWGFAVGTRRSTSSDHNGQKWVPAALGDATCHGGMSVGMGVMLLTAV